MGGVTPDVSTRQSRKAADEVDQQQPGFDLCLAITTVHFNLNQLFLRHVKLLCRLSESLLASALVCASEGAPGEFLDQASLVFRGAAQIRARFCFASRQLCRLHDVDLIKF